MVRSKHDEHFRGAKSEGYLTVRSEPKKNQLTGEAVEMIREFIFKNLTTPTYREMRKIKKLGRS